MATVLKFSFNSACAYVGETSYAVAGCMKCGHRSVLRARRRNGSQLGVQGTREGWGGRAGRVSSSAI